ncbi:MAG: hypothetical protein ACLQF4_09915 [Xanthobacteraceae bacterium]
MVFDGGKIRYGSFECCPAIFNVFEAWVFNLDNKHTWQDVSATEHLMGTAGVMTKAKFDKTFGTLPPLPKGAFQSRPMTVPEASHKPIRAYHDDDGNGVVYLIDFTGPKTFVACRGLDGKWERTGVTDNGLKDYHLELDYDEVLRLAAAARTSLPL